MAVFKEAGVVVTTPSSGTYVIECIGNIGVLADMLGARVREVGGDDAVRRAEEAFPLGSAEGVSSRLSRGAKGSTVRAMAAPKPKREPSKTKAAIAAAKRRARIKAEKLAAEEEARRASREALLRASRGRASPPRISHGPKREIPFAARHDRSLDVERDVAEAAEAMRRMIPAASPSVGLGLPPDADASEEAGDEAPATTTHSDDDAKETEREGTTDVTAASLFEVRLRERFPRGAAFAFDREEAAVCEMRGWDRVAACRVLRVAADAVHVACRTAETNGAFVGAYRVPPRAALRVLIDDVAPKIAGALGGRGPGARLPAGKRSSPPPTFPSGSAERRRAVASAEAAAAALAAALREPGPGAFEPGSWVLERRAAAEAAAAAGSGRKPPRGADAREPFPFAPQEPPGAAGLALPSLARDVALLANEVASFRKETREGLASACASLERVVESIRESLRGEEGGAAAAKPVADARAPRGAVAENEDEKERETAAADEAAAAVAAVAPSPFERSAFVAEARALAALREERKGAKASSDGARGGGATAASEGAEEKDEARGGASPVSRRRGESGESASPDPSRSPPEVVPETPAEENARAATSGGGGFERDSLPMRAPRSLP